MKVLIFGRGWMGKKFFDYLNLQGHTVVLSDADITREDQVVHAIRTHAPDTILNCAGKKGTPNVDWCESHREETFRSNVLGPLVLKTVCEREGKYFVHISTGCIYEGNNNGRGWSEKDSPNYFGSFYSRTKAMAEDLLGDGNILQLRLRMPVTSFPESGNLVTKLVAYRRIISFPNSLSIVDDFIHAATELMKKSCMGIYNVTNPGTVTHAQILDLYKELVDPNYSYSVMSMEELMRITKTGRCNCVLDTSKLAAEGIKMPPIREALRNALSTYALQIDAQNSTSL
ncbi:sugar nucleotide-binding protein [Candidatus Woesearchaeota archaeon]|nr:sugar nucleotide-binding protein [Candidatus Woesearchaeota archaeon]